MNTRIGVRSSIYLALFSSVAFPCGNAWAAVAPCVWAEQLRSRATEVVTIDVMSVAVVADAFGTQRVAAVARVSAVGRTATDLETGQTILIEYTRDVAGYARASAEMHEKAQNGWAGRQLDGIPGVPEAGASYRAYLAKRSVATKRILTSSDLLLVAASGDTIYEPVAASLSLGKIGTDLTLNCEE